MKILVLLFAALLVAGCGEKSTGNPKIDQALKEAVDGDSLEERDGLYYQTNESEPYSGWVKRMWDSEQVAGLTQFKDGIEDGLIRVGTGTARSCGNKPTKRANWMASRRRGT